MTVICGASGAGKTTLARICDRSIPSFFAGELEGDVWLLGERCQDQAVSDFAGRIGFVSQDFDAQLFSTSVIAEIAFGLEQLGVPETEMDRRIATSLAAVGLEGFADRDPASLSGGEKQRLAIAALLALEPELLVLDEPTTDLDPQGKEEVLSVLRSLRACGQTLIVVEHETRAAEMADQVVLLHAGRIVACGPPSQVLSDVALLEANAVRPPDLVKLASCLGWAEIPPSVEEAARRLGVPRRPAVASGSSCPQSQGATVLAAEDLSFRYPDAEAPALRGVSLAIRQREFVALLGQNGSGKTTLARCLAGLLVPAGGRVELCGRPLDAWTIPQRAARIGYVFQNPDQQIFTARVEDEVAFGPRQLGLAEREVQERVRDALALVGLAEQAEADPFWLGKNERQRLAVAAVLAMRPQVVILDEPTTGLDQQEQRALLRLIASLREQGMAVLMITHNPWLVIEGAERCVLLANGEAIFDGGLPDLLGQPELWKRARFRVPPLVELAARCGVFARTAEEFVRALQAGTTSCA
jgi:energy-coupling factor transport system ATP-binding protein